MAAIKSDASNGVAGNGRKFHFEILQPRINRILIILLLHQLADT